MCEKSCLIFHAAINQISSPNPASKQAKKPTNHSHPPRPPHLNRRRRPKPPPPRIKHPAGLTDHQNTPWPLQRDSSSPKRSESRSSFVTVWSFRAMMTTLAAEVEHPADGESEQDQGDEREGDVVCDVAVGGAGEHGGFGGRGGCSCRKLLYGSCGVFV